MGLAAAALGLATGLFAGLFVSGTGISGSLLFFFFPLTVETLLPLETSGAGILYLLNYFRLTFNIISMLLSATFQSCIYTISSLNALQNLFLNNCS